MKGFASTSHAKCARGSQQKVIQSKCILCQDKFDISGFLAFIKVDVPASLEHH
jgi:hypothetical protein